MSVRLTPGIRVVLSQDEFVIANVDHVAGSVRLRSDTGHQVTLSIEEFINHPHLAEVSPSVVPHDDAVDRLDARALAILHKRIAHVYEVETGYRSGTSAVALPDEPRSQYDPATTTLTQRREAKASELNNEHAADAGTKMSVATLRRIAKELADGRGLSGAVDHRLVRRSPGRTSINDQVEAACEQVFEHTRLKSNITHEGRYLLVKQYMRQVHGTDEDVPVERTIRRWFQDRFLPSELNGKARTRQTATSAPGGGYTRPNPTRPGELVCIDTCSLDVLLEGTDFANVVRGVVVLAVDWYSRSIVAVRVLQEAEQAIDVTFLLREIARPKTMLPGWDEETRWPFVGVPESILSEVYGGQNYSGMPFVTPEAVVPDHGSTYKAHLNVATAAQQGISILPARVRKPEDKQVVERTFGSLKTMLLQYLSGFRGADASERGANTDSEVKYSLQDIEDLICWWAVRIWQNHVLSDVRPNWCPEGEFSPNTLYEYGLAQTGLPLRVQTSADYYTSLPCVKVKVHSRGVRVKGLWYDDRDTRVLNDLRNVPSSKGGVGKGTWTVRYDPRDLRQVFIQDADGEFQPLVWVGATKHTPCFSDRHAAALRGLSVQRGIAPTSHEQLAEILLTEILSVHEPVENWASVPKKIRKEAARQRRKAEMVERDQENYGAPTFAQTTEAQDLHDNDGSADAEQSVPERVPGQPAARGSKAAAALRVVPDPVTAQPDEDKPEAVPGDGIAPSGRLDGGASRLGVNADAVAAIKAARAAALASASNSQEQP